MNAKTIVIAVLALIIAAATGLLIQNWMSAQREAMLRSMPKVAKDTGIPKVMVARNVLPAGTFLKPEHLEWREWPKKGIAKNYLVQGKRTINEFVGAVVRRSISAGEPITGGRVVKPGARGYMAAVLTPGMRAVSVPLNATTGIAGFVFPGDRVDLLLTHRPGGKRAKSGQISETVLTGVRVLAVDQRSNDHSQGNAKVPKTTTIEVTPKQAEMVAVAKELGKLSLSLRSLAIEESSGLPAALPMGPARRGRSVTFASDVSRMIGGARRDGGSSVLVIRGRKAASQKVAAEKQAVTEENEGADQ
jgi:pilus assembly protein CpaB